MWKVIVLQLLLLAANQVSAGRKSKIQKWKAREAIDPATLDPTDFQSAVRGYTSLVDSKPYSHFVTREQQWFCIYHLLNFLLPSCGGLLGDITDTETCCKSIQAMVNMDQGDCLCENRVQGATTLIAGITDVAAALQCPISFPIPEAETPQLGLALRATEECEGRNVGGGTLDNAGVFLGLSTLELQNALANGTLPTYREVYQPPPPGPYPTGFTVVNITRPVPSILVNEHSTPEVFGAFIVYPSDAEQETRDPTTGASLNPVLIGTKKFPILAFSPGFSTPPEALLLMMSHLASQGIIVIAQRSTSGVSITDTRQHADDWILDIVYGLQYLKNMSTVEESFLYGRADSDRAAVAGHSFGAIFSLPAAAMAADLGIKIKAVVPISPTCVPFAGNCDTIADADLSSLNRPQILIIAGRQDTLGLPSHAKYLATVIGSSRAFKYRLKFKQLRFFDHCLAEVDPVIWPVVENCGSGDLSPMEQARRVHKIVGDFLARALKAK